MQKLFIKNFHVFLIWKSLDIQNFLNLTIDYSYETKNLNKIQNGLTDVFIELN